MREERQDPLIQVPSFLLPSPRYTRVHCIATHPQLRDLLIQPNEDPGSFYVTAYDTIARHDVLGLSPPQYTRLLFHPANLTSNLGLIAAGGQNGELALKSADPAASWCHEVTAASGSAGHINNSVHISTSPLSTNTPRLLVSSNNEVINVYHVSGRAPDYLRSKRRREKERVYERVEERTMSASDRDKPAFYSSEDEEMDLDEGELDLERGGECMVEKAPSKDIKFRTAVNHCSVSPNGRHMVAVGDTNEIFLFNVMHNGDYELQHTFTGSNDASFSTDWSSNSKTFAVASQDGYCHLYDIRSLPPPNSAPIPEDNLRKLRTFQSSQSGPAGAARKVKFGPSRVDSELLAFTEHRSKVQVIDARTLNEVQILDVPLASTPLPTQSRPHPSSLSSARISSQSRWRESPPRSRTAPQGLVTTSHPPSSAAYAGSATFTSTSAFAAPDRLHRLRERRRTSSSSPGVRSEGSESDGSADSTRPRRWSLAPPHHVGGGPSSRAEWGGGNLLAYTRRGEPGAPRTAAEEAAMIISTSSELLARRNRLDVRDQLRRQDARRRAEEMGENDDDDDDEDDDNEDDDHEEDDWEVEGPPRLDPIGTSSSDTNGSPSSTRRHATAILDSLQTSPGPHFPSLSGYAPLSFRSWRRGGTEPSSEAHEQGASGATFLQGLSVGEGGAAGRASGYQATSIFFPNEITPDDLLGLDWDEWGETLYVATERTVWEWEVDGRGRRCHGTYGFI